jgi:hypothetical protein
MWRVLFIAFLIAHGAVHLAIWATPKREDAPFDPAQSWLVGNQRSLAMVLAIAAAITLIGAGIGLWADAEWWRTMAIIGLAISFGLMVIFFHPWFLPIQVINAALIIGLAWLSWPSETMVGA